MMRHLLITGATICCLAVCWSCSGSAVEKNDADIREAEMAIAQGDMRAAESVTTHIMGSPDTAHLTPSQLGRLSLVYMQLADSTDQGDNVAMATDCYRRAYSANADSARAYYNNVAPEHTPYAVMLATIVSSQDFPTDSLHLDD